MLPEGEALEFPNLASSESFTWRSTKEFTTLTELLESIHWGALGLLLVDLPPGPERTFQFAEYFGAEAPVLLVTQPSEVSQGVVSRAVAALQKVKNRLLGYVENMDGYLCPQCATVSPLFASNLASTLDIPRLGGLPFDPKLAQLCDEGLSIESWSQLGSTDAAERLVDQLIRTLEEAR
jgi:Mrp family chromosome partitioning ATPase